ncbi:dihydroneopterin aldolase [Polynucleobacter sp. AP-Reno-20A-A9]|uniref:dihydroneopterin aldolase n=1 Tax=Polynucleobacter sp. AP-Reno-20A-A9 TaxID=2576925 RepID=UPI001C0C8E85|nr:dihydroneopterin aldolase [Polynucleobacter sp. AP-Reno-20A-A9]MBU3629378.1 dihydroneopterin aldolase [Polynucleobacter sp. AP-Reno-20A-A9]
MSCTASIELKDLSLKTQIGSYKDGDIIPNEHLLDLTLWIDSNLVLIAEDNMRHVFDYDPLVLEIERLGIDGHYETQERLMTRIVQACAVYPQIQSLEIGLRKSPVRDNSGSLGVRLGIGQEDLSKMRG